MTKSRFTIIFISLILSGFIGLAQQKVPAHVILIGIDGLSVDGLKTSLTPNLDTLRKRGCISYKTRGVLPAGSATNWSTILSGAGPEQTGVTSGKWNRLSPELPPTDKDGDGYFPGIFQQLHDQLPKAKLGMFYDWEWLGTYINPKSLSTAKLVKGYQNVTLETTNFLKAQKPLFTFVYYSLPEEVLLDKGPLSPEYKKAINTIDAEIGKIIETTKTLGIYKNTAFVVVSDHGTEYKEKNGVNPANLEVPWLISGPGIRKGVYLQKPNDLMNTAPTIMILLNLYMPESWIGRPYNEVFDQEN